MRFTFDPRTGERGSLWAIKHPTWLDNAHRKLDAAVFEAYGWPHDLSDEEILSKLLALNLERAGK